jgi:MFS superfamily sulfate permease-like transporter
MLLPVTKQDQNADTDENLILEKHSLEPKVLKRVRDKPTSLKELIRGVPHDKPISLSESFTAVLSGLICGVLAVTFNVVKALLTFDAVLQIAPIGVGCYHVTTIIAGLGATFYSSCPISMGGPNIKHALLMSPMVIQPIICKIDPSVSVCATGTSVGAASSGSSTGNSRRMLLAKSGGNSNTTNVFSGPLSDTQETILATSLFAMLYTTLIFSVLWYVVGKYKLSRMLQFLPSFVTSGFIASCGYLIVIKAVLVATNMHVSVQVNHLDVKHVLEGKFWYLLMPALICGMVMFISKHFKIGKIMYVIPLVLIASMGLFFILIHTSGNSVATAREAGWFYQEFPQTPFFKQWLYVTLFYLYLTSFNIYIYI